MSGSDEHYEVELTVPADRYAHLGAVATQIEEALNESNEFRTEATIESVERRADQ